MKQDKITIHGPKIDGTYIVEFKTADGVALAFSVPKGAGLPSWSTSKTRCPTGSRSRMSHGPFQEPFTGQKPFSKRPDPPRAREAGTYHLPPGWRPPTRWLCAWFELHPNLRYIKYKVAEPGQV